MLGSSLSSVVCNRAHVLFTLFVFACHSGVHSVLCFCFVFLRLVYNACMLTVSLDFPFLIALSVFSNIYSINVLLNIASVPYVDIIFGFSVFECSFGIL